MKITEEQKYIFKMGLSLGAAFFVTNVIYIGIQKDRVFAENIMPYFGFLFLGYVAVGIVFSFFYTRSDPGKDRFWKYCMKGAAGVYSIMNLAPFFFIAAIIFAEKTPVRIMLLLDAIVLAIFLAGDYRMAWNMSKKLNGYTCRKKSLIVDLEKYPKTVDEFCGQIADYCVKNHKTLEFVTIGKTMEVLIDGERNTVELEQYYSQFGPVYSMKFTSYNNGK